MVWCGAVLIVDVCAVDCVVLYGLSSFQQALASRAYFFLMCGDVWCGVTGTVILFLWDAMCCAVPCCAVYFVAMCVANTPPSLYIC